MGNIDFSAGAVLTAAQLNDIGEWKSWTPTFTNWTKGNATVDAKYMQVGETIYYQFYYLGQSTSAYTTGGMRFSLPVTESTGLNYQPTGVGWARPNTAGTIYSIFGLEIAGNIVMYSQKTTLDFTFNDVLDSATPATWQTSGSYADIFLQGWYKSV